MPVIVPPLVTLLAAAESAKGSALTEVEVLEIRDTPTAIMLPSSAAAAAAEARGYPDIDPQRAWVEWQAVREAGGSLD